MKRELFKQTSLLMLLVINQLDVLFEALKRKKDPIKKENSFSFTLTAQGFNVPSCNFKTP
jgi:hypothetical protein